MMGRRSKEALAHTLIIQCGCRYWRVTEGRHAALLRRVVAGNRPGSSEMVALDLWPITPTVVPQKDKDRIPWEHGGARNLDLVTPAAAQAYLDKEQS